MAILLPRKPTLICLAVLGPICVADGIVKKDTKEILLMSVVFIYTVVTLINGRRKKLANKKALEQSSTITQTSKP